MTPLIASYLIGAIIVVSINAFIEKKTGAETFLGYGVDYLMGLPVIFLITLITGAELAVLTSVGVELLRKLISLDAQQKILIGLLVGGIHFTIMLLVTYVSFYFSYGNNIYNPRIEKISDPIIRILWVTGGIPLFFIAAQVS